MNEADARRVLLLRAFETAHDTASWTDADRSWASREAARAAGAQADADQRIATRARLAAARLAQREPAVEALLSAGTWRGWLAIALLTLAGLSGFTSDAIGAAQRVNILAPPLLALMLWNLAVYAALALRTVLGSRAVGAAGPLREALNRATRRLALALAPKPHGDTRAAFTRFVADWTRTARDLHGARIATALHLAAAALATGALASMYLRGLAFEYRAGWDSTFLGAQEVRALLAFVLGPASSLSGLALPDVQALHSLRFSAGNGENAARWIHLYALTVAGIVLLPRLALAAGSAWRARRLARDLPLPLDDAYFQRLLRRHSGEPLTIVVLPYSYRMEEPVRAGLDALLERGLGQPVRLAVADALPLGAEDELATHWPTLPPGRSADAAVALFALTATPERETHGAFLQALAERLGDTMPVLVLVDESGWRQRFDSAQGAERAEQRRAAWQHMLADLGQAPLFVDLVTPDLAAIERALERVTPGRRQARVAPATGAAAPMPSPSRHPGASRDPRDTSR